MTTPANRTVTIHPDELPPPMPGTAPATPARIGRFEVRRFLGEGAFGRVYEAYDPSLKRAVALKVAKPEQLAGERRLERFRREARAAAGLLHPNIVAVFDHGEDAGHHYIASAFVPGRTLAEALAARQGPLPVWEAATVARRLAEALAYAHKSGVVHRDVKPANVMLTEAGEPLLMDFGLAARHDEQERLTQDGAVMGTPEYLAPEQWRGNAQPASDQYSLGCVLYEMLTGRTPFGGGSGAHYAVLHLTQAPPPPRSLRKDVPRDLETVCLKCLEKLPERRYADCQALADDLRRWLDGEPVSARRPGLGERLAKWARREPALAGALATVAVVTAASLAIISGLLGEALAKGRLLKDERDKALKAEADAEAARRQADEARKEAERRARADQYAFRLAQVHRESTEGSSNRAIELLLGSDPEQRSWEYDYLRMALPRLKQERRYDEWKKHSAAMCVRYDSSGRWLAVGMQDGTIHLWNARTRRTQRVLPGTGGTVWSLHFSPDGRWLASSVGGRDKDDPSRLRIWDVGTGQLAHDLTGHKRQVFGARFAKGGEVLLGADASGAVRVWDARTGEERPGFSTGMPLQFLELAPNGRWFAAAGKSSVTLRDVNTGEVSLTLGGSKSIQSLAFSASGAYLAVADYADGVIRVWDSRSGKLLRTFGDGREGGHVSGLAFAPNRNWLVAGMTGAVTAFKLYDVESGEELASVSYAGAGSGEEVCFSPDGSYLATSARPGAALYSLDHLPPAKKVSLCNEPPTPESTPAPAPVLVLDDVPLVASPPDGKRNLVEVKDPRTGLVVATFPNVGTADGQARFVVSPDASLRAEIDDDTVVLRDGRTDRLLRGLGSPSDPIDRIAFSPDGLRLAGRGKSAVKLWDCRSGAELLSLSVSRPPQPGAQQEDQVLPEKIIEAGRAPVVPEKPERAGEKAGDGKMIELYDGSRDKLIEKKRDVPDKAIEKKRDAPGKAIEKRNDDLGQAPEVGRGGVRYFVGLTRGAEPPLAELDLLGFDADTGHLLALQGGKLIVWRVAPDLSPKRPGRARENWPLRLMIAEATQDWAEAQRCLAPLVAEHPENSALKVRQARALLRGGSEGAAVEVLIRGTESAPKSRPAWWLDGMQADLEAAGLSPALCEALAARPGHWPLQALCGWEDLQAGQLDLAVTNLSAAARQARDRFDLWTLLAQAEARRGNVAGLEAVRREVARGNRDYLEALDSWLDTGKHKRPDVQVWSLGNRLKRPLPPALAARLHASRAAALALIGWDRLPEAAEDWRQAVKLQPADVGYRCSYAETLLTVGDVPGYRRECGELIKRVPCGPDEARQVARACLLAPKALPNMNPVIRLAEWAADAGAVSQRQRHRQVRNEDQDQIVPDGLQARQQRFQERPWCGYLVGAALLRAERYAEAIRYLSRLKEEDPVTQLLWLAYDRSGDKAATSRLALRALGSAEWAPVEITKSLGLSAGPCGPLSAAMSMDLLSARWQPLARWDDWRNVLLAWPTSADPDPEAETFITTR